MEKWKANIEWSKGKCKFIKQFISDSFTQELKDREEEHLYNDVVTMLGYEPEDWALTWERVDG